MKYSKNPYSKLTGLGKIEREKYSALLRGFKATISVADAASTLNIQPDKAAMLLALFARKGWLKRIHYGVYIPIPLESTTSDVLPEEPFAIANELFSPCYIGGMNAANYWNLTEQIFRTITVMTQKQLRDRRPNIAGIEYAIHTIKPRYFFGLKSIWAGQRNVNLSDPTRTILDMAIFPQFCGGLRFITDVLQNYWRSEHKNVDLLIEYLIQAQNGAAIKRLGFLVEKYFPQEDKLITHCLNNLTQGYVKIMPERDCPRLISHWRLWVPNNWKDLKND